MFFKFSTKKDCEIIFGRKNIGEKKIFLVENEILMIRDQTGSVVRESRSRSRKILDLDNRIFD